MKYFCTDCDSEVSEQDKFCANCGSNVEQTVNESLIECSSCGNKISDTATFCPECGVKNAIGSEASKNDLSMSKDNSNSSYCRCSDSARKNSGVLNLSNGSAVCVSCQKMIRKYELPLNYVQLADAESKKTLDKSLLPWVAVSLIALALIVLAVGTLTSNQGSEPTEDKSGGRCYQRLNPTEANPFNMEIICYRD